MQKNDNNKNIRCSFCGKTQDSVDKIVAGPGVYICNECIQVCSNIIENEYYEDDEDLYTTVEEDVVPTPEEIKKVLDEYVIGQEDAKKTLSVAVYNHYKRINNEDEKNNKDDIEIKKSNEIPFTFTQCFFHRYIILSDNRIAMFICAKCQSESSKSKFL